MSNATQLPFAVYDDNGALNARCVDFYVAAAIVGNVMQDGAQVRYGKTVLWTEGEDHDGFAGESYDNAADVMDERLRAFFQRKVARREAKRVAAALDRTAFVECRGGCNTLVREDVVWCIDCNPANEVNEW